MKKLALIFGLVSATFLFSPRLDAVDFQIHDQSGNEVIASLAEELGLSSKDPCVLMPYLELSSLLAVDQLQSKLLKDRSTPLTTKQLWKARHLYYQLGLFAESYSMCYFSSVLGALKAYAIAKQWLSGYSDLIWKLNTGQHFKNAIFIGIFGSPATCLSTLENKLKSGVYKITDVEVYKPVLSNLNHTLIGMNIEPTTVGAAIESVAVRCLDSTPGLTAFEKMQISVGLGKSAAIFRQMEGSALRKALPNDAVVGELTYMVESSMERAPYLKPEEKARRRYFMERGKKDIAACNLRDSFKDCMLYSLNRMKGIIDKR